VRERVLDAVAACVLVVLGVWVGVGSVIDLILLLAMSNKLGRRGGSGNPAKERGAQNKGVPGTRTMFSVGWRWTLRGRLNRADVAAPLAGGGGRIDRACMTECQRFSKPSPSVP